MPLPAGTRSWDGRISPRFRIAGLFVYYTRHIWSPDDGPGAAREGPTSRLAEAERHALTAKAEYHAAVRRLHLGGGSLREIADALGVSHQRVQQIVDATGGSWWQRVWKSRNTRDAVCTFCERPPSEVAKLIAGPNIYICDRCTTGADTAAAGKPAPEFKRVTGLSKRCGFCSRSGRAGRRVMAGLRVNVCTDCLEQCRKILADRA